MWIQQLLVKYLLLNVNYLVYSKYLSYKSNKNTLCKSVDISLICSYYTH